MNCFQRSTRMEAFGSGVLVHSAARTGTMPGPASSAAPPRPTLSTLRLSKSLIVLSLNFIFVLGRLVLGSSSASLYAFARRLVEQMNHGGIGLQFDLVTRVELVTFAEDRDDLLTTELRKHLRFRAGRLDHDDLGIGAVVSDGEMLGTHAVNDRTPVGRRRRVPERQLDAVRPLEGRNAVDAHMTLQEVHGWRADEAGDELVVGLVVELERRTHLLDNAVMHDDDLVGHGHGLDLIVGDIDGRGLQPLVQLLDLGAHRNAQLGVEVRQGLVEQEHLRIAYDGAAHGDALALAAGELARIAFEQRRQRQDLGGALDALVDLFGALAPQLHRETHVLADRHVRIERVVLEHHRNVPLLGLDIVDDAVADRNRA